MQYGLKVDIAFSGAKTIVSWLQRAIWNKRYRARIKSVALLQNCKLKLKKNLLFQSVKKCFLLKKLTQKVTSYEKCSYNSSFEVQITWRLLRFNTADVSKYWKIVQFRKISIKIENCKTFYEAHTASRLKEIVQPHPPPHTPVDKILLRLWNKFFLGRYTEICRYLLSNCFKEVVLGRQEIIHCKYFFWH